MNHEFKDWTSRAIHAEELPDSSPNPVRTALEQAATHGQDAGRPCELRRSLSNGVEGGGCLDADEQKLQQLLIAAIDQEIESSSARANLDGTYLARANLARADLDGAYLGRACLGGVYLGGVYLYGAYDEHALEDIKRCAAEQVTAAEREVKAQ